MLRRQYESSNGILPAALGFHRDLAAALWYGISSALLLPLLADGRVQPASVTEHLSEPIEPNELPNLTWVSGIVDSSGV